MGVARVSLENVGGVSLYRRVWPVMVMASTGVCRCGHRSCRKMWVWSLFQETRGGVDIVSVGTYGCGHSFSKNMGLWSVFLQEHVGVVIVFSGTCGCGHYFIRDK